MKNFLDRQREYAPYGPLADDFSTRALIAAGLFCVAMFIVLLPAMAFDPRILDGAYVWIKPQKFAVSLGLHFFTLAILAQQIPQKIRSGPILSFFVLASIASLMLEAGYVCIQAARARRSHYNFETPIEATMYAFMGIGAVFLVIVALVLAIQVWRAGQRDLQGLRWGTIIGLSVGTVSNLIFAGYMSSSEFRLVGEPVTGAVVPFFGWSREVGDLRPAHFVALHMMQTLPLLGYIFDKTRMPARLGVVIAAALQLGLAAALFFQALAGKPFWPV